MNVSKYISNRLFNRGMLALDIKHRNITGHDVDELITAINQAVSDKIIEDPFVHHSYQKKKFWEWNEDYLDSLYAKSFSECFDYDYQQMPYFTLETNSWTMKCAAKGVFSLAALGVGILVLF